MAELNRNSVHQELVTAPAHYRLVIESATPTRLRQRTVGTRWTNREMLFHLLLGYLVVRAMLPVVSLIARLPSWAGRGFAATLNAAARPFHVINYLGSVLGGHLLSLSTMAMLFERTCIALALRLDRATDTNLARGMPLPKRWDPFFTDHMGMLEVYHYPWQHFEFHRQQLTLDLPLPGSS